MQTNIGIDQIMFENEKSTEMGEISDTLLKSLKFEKFPEKLPKRLKNSKK